MWLSPLSAQEAGEMNFIDSVSCRLEEILDQGLNV